MPFHGTRISTDRHDLVGTCAAIQSVLSASSAFVGPTAALLRGMPLPRSLESVRSIHVSTTADHRATRHNGTIGTRRPVWWSVDEIGGLRVVGRVETWMSLASFLGADDLTAVADFLIGPTSRHPLAVDDLFSAVARQGSRRGIRDLRTAAAAARVGVRSRPETHLRLLLVDLGPREPDVAEPVLLSSGTFVHPDLSWSEFRVAVEYDGAGHRDADQHAIDVARHEELVDDGWSVLHVVARDLYSRPSLIVARALTRLRAAGWDEPRTELTRFGRFSL